MLKGLREDRKQEVGKSVLVSSFQMCPRTAVVKQEAVSGLALTLRTGRTMPLAQECEKEHGLWNKA